MVIFILNMFKKLDINLFKKNLKIRLFARKLRQNGKRQFSFQANSKLTPHYTFNFTTY